MRRLKVGEPLHPGVTGYEEGVHYNYTSGGHSLFLSTKDPVRSEIDDLRYGQSVFALNVAEEVLFLFAKFGDCPWKAAHYNWWINPPALRPDPAADLDNLDGGLSLGVCMVNAANGVVEALRTVRLSYDFGRSLLENVELQTRSPLFDPRHYLEVVTSVCKRYSNPGEILKEAACLCTAAVVFNRQTTTPTPQAYH